MEQGFFPQTIKPPSAFAKAEGGGSFGIRCLLRFFQPAQCEKGVNDDPNQDRVMKEQEFFCGKNLVTVKQQSHIQYHHHYSSSENCPQPLF